MHADFITNTLMHQIWFMIVDLFGHPSGTFCGDEWIQIIWNLIYYLDDKITGYLAKTNKMAESHLNTKEITLEEPKAKGLTNKSTKF